MKIWTQIIKCKKKAEDEKSGRYKIFMVIAEHIGYDATGQKDAKNDLDKAYKEFKKFEK